MAKQQTIIAIASVTKWEEDRSLTTTPRITPAHVAFAAPDISATMATDYLMTYLSDGNASFIFTERVEAKDFDGKEGSFITQGKGKFDASSYSVMGDFEIVKGTGTGGLEGVEGKGNFGPGGQATKLKYEFSIEV